MLGGMRVWRQCWRTKRATIMIVSRWGPMSIIEDGPIYENRYGVQICGLAGSREFLVVGRISCCWKGDDLSRAQVEAAVSVWRRFCCTRTESMGAALSCCPTILDRSGALSRMCTTSCA